MAKILITDPVSEELIQILKSAGHKVNYLPDIDSSHLISIIENYDAIAVRSRTKVTRKVIDAGKQIFGDKFQPLIEFMPFKDYLELLGKIDIAIFNHNRQQAMGNITTLLGLGKKVYVRSNETPWKMFNKLQIKVYDTALDISIDAIDEDIKKQNQKRVKAYFSEENLIKDWEQILGKERG